MSTDERLDRLERRVAVLEQLLREQAQRGVAASRAPVEEATLAEMPPAAVPEIPKPAPTPPLPEWLGPPQAHRPRPSPQPMRGPAAVQSSVLDEKWIGQRAFLAVGVVALLLATGYLLKLSFERGWISPVMRCTGGALLGVVVGAIGWRLYERYRVYGASLIGTGCGIIYLSVWAACRLYEVIPPTTGIVGLALVSVALAMIAYAINVEALCTIAALGAFMAPVLLGRDDANAHVLMLYLASMAAGLGLVAAQRGWRLTMFVVAASYLGLGSGGAGDSANPMALLVYGVIGGTAGLYVGLKRRWLETRFLTFSGGWGIVAQASDRMETHWPVFVSALILSAPVWWHALRNPWLAPTGTSGKDDDGGMSAGEALYFLITPLLLAWATYGLAPDRFDADPGLLPALIGLPYLAVGYLLNRLPFTIIGFAATLIAVGSQFGGLTEVWVLIGLALLWPASDRPLNRTDGRWYGFICWVAAINSLVSNALPERTANDAAFFGPWAIALWAVTAVAVALASGLLKAKPEEGEAQLARQALWVVSGLLVFFGVTAEIRRYFELKTLSSVTAELASGLAVSAWWLVFAAALILFGFRRGIKPIRLAGLAAAGLAVAKVVLFDLSSLDALYRIGSVFFLALVMLSLAYVYYRQDRSETEGGG